jgi:hypothetical protein
MFHVRVEAGVKEVEVVKEVEDILEEEGGEEVFGEKGGEVVDLGEEGVGVGQEEEVVIKVVSIQMHHDQKQGLIFGRKNK